MTATEVSARLHSYLVAQYGKKFLPSSFRVLEEFIPLE